MRILAFLTILALSLPVAASAEGRLTVSGEASVSSVPDMATISLGATGRGPTAAEAMNASSEALSAVFARLEALGVEARDIQTTQLRLDESTRYDGDRDETILLGYIARNDVRVRVRDLDDLGSLMAQLLDQGANRFQGLSFSLQDPRVIEDEARRRAVADAMAKARLYADAAGVELGEILSISDTAEPRVTPIARTEPMLIEEALVLDLPVAAGETSVRAEVTMVFAIAE